MRRVVVALSSILAACGGSDPAAPAPDGVEGSFSATIDGADWAPASVDSVENLVPGRYAIVAGIRGGSDYVIDLSLHNIGGPGTYPLGVSHSVFGGEAQVSHPGSIWVTPYTGLAGEVVITMLSATRIAGTFGFMAAPHTATVVNTTVAQGVFDLPVAGTAGVAAPSQGSSFTATIDGIEIVFPIAGPWVMFGDELRFGAYSDDYRFVASIDAMTGVGTYALSDSTRSMMLASPPGAPTGAWSTNASGGSGTIEITSAASGRYQGTLTATLIAVYGDATGSKTISGTYDFGSH
jgi:hypothetical protein